MENGSTNEDNRTPTAPHKPLIDGIKRFHSNEEYSDLAITCKYDEWKVHKIILASQPEFFHSACSGGFREAKESKINLDNDEPGIVNALIHYFYNFDYENAKGLYHVNELVLDVHMFNIADKYLVEPLKKLAASKFDDRAKRLWFTDQFAWAIAEIYKSSAKDIGLLKQTVIKVAIEHRDMLLDEERTIDQVRNVLRKTPDFGADLSMTLAKTKPKQLWYKCPDCEKIFSLLEMRYMFRCPYDCSGPQTNYWWKEHIITDMKS